MLVNLGVAFHRRRVILIFAAAAIRLRRGLRRKRIQLKTVARNISCGEADPPSLSPRKEPAPSDEGDALGFEALLTVDHLDPDPLAGIERVDAAAAQRGDVDKHILAAAIG